MNARTAPDPREQERLRWVLAHPTHHHEHTGPLHRDRLAFLRREALEAGPGRWLVLGCGGGWLEQDWPWLSPPVSLDLAHQYVRLRHGVQANVLALPFAAGAFDGVVASEVLEHVAAPATALAQIARVLKPGGTFVITVPNRFALENLRGRLVPHPRRGHHLTRLPPHRWRGLITGAGLRITREEPLALLPYVPYFLAPLKRLEQALLPPALDSTRKRMETTLARHWPFSQLGLCHAFVGQKP